MPFEIIRLRVETALWEFMKFNKSQKIHKKHIKNKQMKAIFLVALLAITASASLTDNKCFMEKAGSAVASVASALKSANTLQSLDSYEQILT